MIGEFTLEDKSGNIVFASSPGMGSSAPGKTEAKKTKTSVKRLARRPEIKIFVDLAEEETDTQWEERFQKMAMSRFPAKISWNPTVDLTDEPQGTLIDHFYGELVYKNRQIVKNLKLRKDEDLHNIRMNIKSFIQNYTNVDMEQADDEFATDAVQPIPKTRIVPVPWAKLSAKDQALALTDYVKGFSIENTLTKEESESFIRYLTIFAMGRNIVPFIVFDKDGSIERLKGVVKEKTGYKLKPGSG